MTSKSKKDKSRDKGTKDKRSGGQKRNDGNVEIAKAEQALAKALRKVEDARSKVMRRERELLELMRKHGRIPMDETYEPPILDQLQIDGGEIGESDDSKDAGENGAERADSYADGPVVATVALFDQKQVVES